jgi:thiol-disulfide isomerase/thioredoxin
MIRKLFFSFLGCLIASAIALAEDPQPAKDAWKKDATPYLVEYDALLTDAERKLEPAFNKWEIANRTAKNQVDREQAHETWIAEYRAVWSPTMRKALELIEPHAAESASINPLWTIVDRSEPKSEAGRAALDLVVKHHLTNQVSLKRARGSRLSRVWWVEQILRAQLAAVDLPEDERPKQMFALATCLKRAAELSQVDSETLETEAIRLFTEVSQRYPDKELAPGLSIAAAAKGGAFAIQCLRLGKTAPDIEGEDLDGASFKLSDYRGKVVMISFWASWCGPCMALVPHELELLEQYTHRPFAIVGVNSDPEREKLKLVLEENKITWRSFWCGEKGPFGAIPTLWSVQSWPTLYLLDRTGVIRANDLSGTALDEKIAELVDEAERAERQN